jgi:hypothetical protein
MVPIYSMSLWTYRVRVERAAHRPAVRRERGNRVEVVGDGVVDDILIYGICRRSRRRVRVNRVDQDSILALRGVWRMKTDLS